MTAHVRETDQLQPLLFKLAPYRIPELRLFRRNVALVRIEGRRVKFGIKGQPDVYGITRGGRHIELELKAARGKLTPEQEVWAAWCTEWRVPYLALKAGKLETAEQTVERWCGEILDALTGRPPPEASP